jgi:serine/threonine protein kinase
VGSIDEQVFIVMEFVVGQSLRKWIEKDARSWRDVLAVYLEAGQGLAAAHAVGLIHRDFKPDNVQVGTDGRTRVLDFGLARGRIPREGGESADPRFDSGERVGDLDDTWRLDNRPPRAAVQLDGDSGPASNKRLLTPLTATGARLGTPAYMSPEQFEDADVGPESDQFSFCLSLYQGLYGQHAFAGETVGELRQSMREGKILNQNIETQQQLARARLTLATALWQAHDEADGKARTRAEELVSQAEAWYRGAGPGYERHLQEVAAWRAVRGPIP